MTRFCSLSHSGVATNGFPAREVSSIRRRPSITFSTSRWRYSRDGGSRRRDSNSSCTSCSVSVLPSIAVVATAPFTR